MTLEPAEAPVAECSTRSVVDAPSQPVEARLERFSTRVDPWMTALAVAWLPVLVVPLITDLHGSSVAVLSALDYFVWTAFAVEHGIKICLAGDRRSFFRHHLLDLAVIAVPILRPVRLAELFRVVRLARVTAVLGNGLRRARAMLTHHGLHFVLLAVVAIVFAGAALEAVLERHAPGASIRNFGDGLWWAVVTVTTVGYGDKVPVTGAGKIVAAVLMVTGIGLVGFLTATIASYFVNEQQVGNLAEVREKLDEVLELLHDASPAGLRQFSAEANAGDAPGSGGD